MPTLLVFNIVISIAHALKHVPQCLYMIENQTAEGLSMCYIQGELVLNLLSILTTFEMFMTIQNSVYLIPILIEKSFAFSMIVVMFYLKNKYTHENDEYKTWKEVESDYEEDWHTVVSDYDTSDEVF